MTSIQIPHQRTSPDREAAPAAPVAAVVELRWGPLLRRTAARAGLTVVASLVLWSVLPALLGWAPQVILSGSMEPRIHSGDVIVTREVPAEKISKGKVITVQDPDHPAKTRTHRVVRRSADGTIVTKGDANQQADSSSVKDADVIGMGVIRVPYVGRPAYWMVERNYAALGVTLLLLGWCAVSAFPGRVKPHDPDDTDLDEAGPAGPAPRVSADPRRDRRRGVSARRRRAAAAVAMSVVAVGALGAPASAVFKRATLNPSSTLKAASTFYPYRTEVLGDSPYLFWRVNETSGVAMNDAGTGNKDGTLLGQTYALGQASALVSEPRDKALGLTIGVINANTNVTAPGTFSVEAWVRSTSNSGGRILGFGNGTGSNPSSVVDRQLYLAPTGKVMFGIGSTKKTVASSGTVNNGAWHHVVGTYGSGTMRLYVDGVSQGSSTANTISMSGIWRAGAEQMSGWAGNPTDQYFEGTLDELAVYTDVVTPAEVLSHYNAGKTP